MRQTLRRGQLALMWMRDGVQWDDLPEAARAELHGLLRELLRNALNRDPLVGAEARDE